MHGLADRVRGIPVVMSLIAAAASWMRGGKYVHLEEEAVPVPGAAGARKQEVSVGPFGAPPEEQPDPDEGPPPEEWVPG